MSPTRAQVVHQAGVLSRFRDLLDVPGADSPVTLHEGATPLIDFPRLAAEIGAAQLFVKFEGANPTGSFKDRGMTAAITQAVHAGATSVVCASTGNTAASAAAYAARAGLSCLVLIPRGKVSAGKLAGAVAHAARVAQIDGSFDVALDLVRRLCERRRVTLVNSLNPYRIEGQKTVAFEICDELGEAPDLIALPVGNAGNITALWRGLVQYHSLGRSELPQLLGVQASGAAPLVVGHDVENPETLATAIRIGRPARGEEALRAAGESGGRIVAVPDDSLVAAQMQLASQGLWVEPASAAGLAGLLQEVREGRLSLDGRRVAVICTGHGLKDPDIVTRQLPDVETIAADLDALDGLL